MTASVVQFASQQVVRRKTKSNRRPTTNLQQPNPPDAVQLVYDLLLANPKQTEVVEIGLDRSR